jgi:GNAT superfamily N-acetyltransferase
VASEADEVLGFAMVDPETACLFAAFVLPEQEGRGMGRALIAACEAALFARHDMIWLETDGASRAAGIYQRLGWRVTQ